MQLTAFEQEVFDICGALILDGSTIGDNEHILCALVKLMGQRIYGPNWGGASIGHGPLRTYPALNTALGRLEKKGLVTRYYDEDRVFRWANWELTAQARELLGLPSVASSGK